MQLVWVNTTTGDEQRWTIHGRSAFLRLTETGELKASASPTSLRIDIEGQNVFLLDTGDGSPAAIADIEVEKGRRRAWGRNQELRIGANIVLWVADAAELRARTPVSPDLLWRIGAILAVLILLASLFTLVMNRTTTAWGTVATITPLAPPTATSAPMLTHASPTPTPTPMPSPTATSTATPVLATMVSPLHTPLTPTPDPPPPPTVAIASPAGPETWDARLDALGVRFIPAIVPVGGEFWRLVEAQWLDEHQSSGRHHIFVDAVDAHQNRFQDREVRISVSWNEGNSACTPVIDPNAQRAFGADCPMYSAGYAYAVAVDGLPSDQVQRIGLGTIENRFAPVLTSFTFRFRLERRSE